MKTISASPARPVVRVFAPVAMLGGMVVLAGAFQAPPTNTFNPNLPDAAASRATFVAPGNRASTPGAPALPGQTVPGQMIPGSAVPGQPLPGQPLPGQAAPGQMPGMLPPMAPGQTGAGTLAPAPLPAGMQGDPRLNSAFARGVEAQQKGDLKTAVEAYREVLRLQPKASPAHINLALILIQQKQAERAVWHLKQDIAVAPREVQPRAILAQVYLGQKQPRKAFEQWTQLADSNPQDNGRAAFTAGAIAFEQLKKPEEAERWLRLSNTQNKNSDPRVALYFARVLNARGKASEAVGVLKAASAKFPKITGISTALAESQWQSGDKSGAVVTLRALEKSTPASDNGGLNLSQVRVMLGRALAQQKQFPEAAKTLRQAMSGLPAKSPTIGPTRLLLAQTLASQAGEEEQKGLTENAIATWGDAIQIFPDNALGYLQRARLTAKIGDERGALTDYNRALKLAPRDPNILAGAAKMEESAGDASKAISHWKTLIETQPTVEDAYFNLTRLGAKRKQFAEQMDYLETRIRKNPDFRAPYEAVLETGEKSGRKEIARDWVFSMARRYPKSSGPRNALIAFDRRNPTVKPDKTPTPVATRAPIATPRPTLKATPTPAAPPKPNPNKTPALTISPNGKPNSKVTIPAQPEPASIPKILKPQPALGEGNPKILIQPETR